MSATAQLTYNKHHSQSVLDSFIQRAVLFSALYLVIGSVYQQAYLHTLGGLRISVIDPNQLLPAFNNIYLLIYVAMLGLIGIFLPDRWYSHIAEVFNLSTWHGDEIIYPRISAIFLAYEVFGLTNIYEILFPFKRMILMVQKLNIFFITDIYKEVFRSSEYVYLWYERIVPESVNGNGTTP